MEISVLKKDYNDALVAARASAKKAAQLREGVIELDSQYRGKSLGRIYGAVDRLENASLFVLDEPPADDESTGDLPATPSEPSVF